jgi:CheY-like chemotaxis protein
MTDCGDAKVIDVLMVDDDEGDVLMTREAFEYYKIRNRLHVVPDGDQALDFLRRTGAYADAPRPGLILLDVNLPRRSGLEILAELKGDPDLLLIPVVMLTTSRAEEDIVRSYSLHANAFISKPVDFEHFIEAIRQIDNFFLTLVCLPNLSKEPDVRRHAGRDRRHPRRRRRRDRGLPGPADEPGTARRRGGAPPYARLRRTHQGDRADVRRARLQRDHAEPLPPRRSRGQPG